MARMTVNLCEAKTSLSKLVERGAAGDRALRKSGGWEDKAWVADEFRRAFAAETLDGFEGRARRGCG